MFYERRSLKVNRFRNTSWIVPRLVYIRRRDGLGPVIKRISVKYQKFERSATVSGRDECLPWYRQESCPGMIWWSQTGCLVSYLQDWLQVYYRFINKCINKGSFLLPLKLSRTTERVGQSSERKRKTKRKFMKNWTRKVFRWGNKWLVRARTWRQDKISHWIIEFVRNAHKWVKIKNLN